jgi:hypothetical protein
MMFIATEEIYIRSASFLTSPNAHPANREP